MVYTPGIPLAGDDPKISQRQIADNFSKLNNDFSINHTAFNSGANSGFHKLIQFPNFIPIPSLSGSVSAAFPIQSTTNTSELAYINGTGFNNLKQLTGLGVYNGSIQAINTANPVQITSLGHGLATNNFVNIYFVFGNAAVQALNYTQFQITVVDANNFTLNGVDGTGFAYTGGGRWTTTAASTTYGIDTPWGLTYNFGTAMSSPWNLAIAIPAGRAIYTAQGTGINIGSGNFRITSVTNEVFPTTASQMKYSPTNVSIYYFIISQS